MIDEFGVYSQDPAGRPSTDPGLYARAQALANGSRLVAADGFDGIYVPDGFSLSGKGQIAAGALSLATGGALTLPAIKTGDSAVAVSADLAGESARKATLILAWEGSTTPALSLPLAADASGFSFRIGPMGLSVSIPSGASEKTVSIPAPEHQRRQPSCGH